VLRVGNILYVMTHNGGIKFEGSIFKLELKPQTITFLQPGDKTVGQSFQLNATSSSGLPVFYTSTSNVTISGTKATVTDARTARIWARQSGGQGYAPAPTIVQSFTVTP